MARSCLSVARKGERPSSECPSRNPHGRSVSTPRRRPWWSLPFSGTRSFCRHRSISNQRSRWSGRCGSYGFGAGQGIVAPYRRGARCRSRRDWPQGGPVAAPFVARAAWSGSPCRRRIAGDSSSGPRSPAAPTSRRRIYTARPQEAVLPAFRPFGRYRMPTTSRVPNVSPTIIAFFSASRIRTATRCP